MIPHHVHQRRNEPIQRYFPWQSAAKSLRVADTQKCLRVSGKHNDLEEVGHDTYHHTMFEMLGNWSFGDYFKEEAIDWAWEFLHERMGIPQTGCMLLFLKAVPEEGLTTDDEAKRFWLRHLPEERILPGNKKDNFGDGRHRPCGPCSEIHVDLRDDSERTKIADANWLTGITRLSSRSGTWYLFSLTQGRRASGRTSGQTRGHGMGFERLCMVLHGKEVKL
jgi:alanyl-tRNA synthetase